MARVLENIEFKPVMAHGFRQFVYQTHGLLDGYHGIYPTVLDQDWGHICMNIGQLAACAAMMAAASVSSTPTFAADAVDERRLLAFPTLL